MIQQRQLFYCNSVTEGHVILFSKQAAQHTARNVFVTSLSTTIPLLSLTYPIFATDKTEPANIVIPVSEKVYRTIQSSLDDSPAGCGVKLTDSFDDLTVRIRLQIEYTSRISLSILKSILTICFESLKRFYSDC